MRNTARNLILRNIAKYQQKNRLATALTSVGQTETAVRIRQQIEDLNARWRALEEQTEQREQQLGSAHEVQKFHRDVDETRDWIQEKVRFSSKTE